MHGVRCEPMKSGQHASTQPTDLRAPRKRLRFQGAFSGTGPRHTVDCAKARGEEGGGGRGRAGVGVSLKQHTLPLDAQQAGQFDVHCTAAVSRPFSCCGNDAAAIVRGMFSKGRRPVGDSLDGGRGHAE